VPGWQNSDRRSRLPADWNERVAKVWARDGGRCTWRLPSGARCPRPGRDVDHRRNDDNHSLDNLQLLCGDHHDKKTQGEARRAKAARRKKPRRPEEQHPGLRSR
jgi:5-methylcytosine-specific restriction endonuclease McrA